MKFFVSKIEHMVISINKVFIMGSVQSWKDMLLDGSESKDVIAKFMEERIFPDLEELENKLITIGATGVVLKERLLIDGMYFPGLSWLIGSTKCSVNVRTHGEFGLHIAFRFGDSWGRRDQFSVSLINPDSNVLSIWKGVMVDICEKFGVRGGWSGAG